MNMTSKLKKFITTVPKEWAEFIKTAPKEFRVDYLYSQGFTPEKFLEMSAATKIFDDAFFKNDQTDFIYWWSYGDISWGCKGWELNSHESFIYGELPEIFTQEQFIKLRKGFLPISSQDKMLGGILFKQYPIKSVNGRDDLAKLVGRCYQKTIIKPALK